MISTILPYYKEELLSDAKTEYNRTIEEVEASLEENYAHILYEDTDHYADIETDMHYITKDEFNPFAIDNFNPLASIQLELPSNMLNAYLYAY